MEALLLNKTRNPPNSNQQSIANANFIKDVLLHQTKVIPKGVCPMDELSLIYDANDQKDINELRDILSKKLSYPSTEIADLHMEANRLGVLDEKNETAEEEDADTFTRISENAKFCPCCGFMIQESTLSTCATISKINHVGISTYLYFATLRNLIILLTLMFFVFSIYAIASNVVASNLYRKELNNPDIDERFKSYNGFLVISLGSKQLHETEDDKRSFMIQCWLGVAMIVLWGILFAIIKQRERKAQIEIDIDSKNAGDFSILVKNYPKNLTIGDFEAQLNEYRKNVGKSGYFHYEQEKEIVVSKINLVTPFYLNSHSFDDDELDRINDEYEKYESLFVEWIEERTEFESFSTEENERKKAYEQFELIKKQREAKYVEISQKIRKEAIEKEQGETMPAFVTFNSSYNRNFLLDMHDDQTFFAKRLPCTDREKFFYFDRIGQRSNVLAEIRQAPEPEDIIWTNMGQDNCSLFSKKLFTYFIGIITLGGSFAAVYGLSKVQYDLSNQVSRTASSYISGLISLCISIINILIGQVLRFLTKIERNPTHTQQQVSLGMKAVFALLINSILIPILVNYFFKENLYGTYGLAYDVFFIGITNSFLIPILKIFDIYYYFTRLFAWYKKKPLNKLTQNQNELNSVTEYMEFELGYEYIYMVNLFLFTCFFASLQPIIVLFAISGMSLTYWAQKYSLFNRCKRPIPGNNVVNTAMYQLIYLGPALYTIGSFCWSHFFKTDWIGVAPNLVAAILSGIIFLIPYKRIIKEVFTQELPEEECIFIKDRIFLPSEYDRLNPATSAQGVRDYMDFLAEYKKSMQSKTPEEIKYIEKEFFKQIGCGAKRNDAIIPNLVNTLSLNRGINYSENQIILQELFGQNKNSFNPMLIGNTVLYGNRGNEKKEFFSMITQNWLTDKEASKNIGQLNGGSEGWNNGKESKPKNIGNNLFIPQAQNFRPTTSHIKKIGEESSKALEENPRELDENGNLNHMFQGIEETNQNSENFLNIPYPPQNNEIPLNIPLNLFGNLLSGPLVMPDPQSMQNQNYQVPNIFEQLFQPYGQLQLQNEIQQPFPQQYNPYRLPKKNEYYPQDNFNLRENDSRKKDNSNNENNHNNHRGN